MIADFSDVKDFQAYVYYEPIEYTMMGEAYKRFLPPPKSIYPPGTEPKVVIDDRGLPFISAQDGIISVQSVGVSNEVGNFMRISLEGIIMPGQEYKLVAARCHLCFAPLIKEGSERERDLKTGLWIERATGEYACGTTVVFEPDKKLAVTPGAKVRIGPKCVKLLKKK